MTKLIEFLNQLTKRDTVSSGGLQSDIFGFTESDPKSQALMEVMDRINQKYSKGTLKTAAEGQVQAWKMQRKYLSPLEESLLGSWGNLENGLKV